MQHLMIGSARGSALFVGGFLAVNGLLGLVGVIGLIRPGFDAGGLVVSTPAGSGLRIALGLVLLLWGLMPRTLEAPRLRLLPCAAASGLGVIALLDARAAWSVFQSGAVTPRFPIPLSVGWALLCFTLAWLARPRSVAEPRHWSQAPVIGSVCLAFIVVFPATQFVAYGMTDYRRAADVIVVFGARAYADGRPSDALADRVRTAVEVYHEGYAPRLIMSGGPGDGDVHEAEAMRSLAMELGVPEEAIELDRGGLNTEASVVNTTASLEAHGETRVLAVSHDFHLPRIRMAYQRAGYSSVATVPAGEGSRLRQTPFLWLRETAAFWVYWARGG
jgi:vancomycin permeability regulator SanA